MIENKILPYSCSDSDLEF